MIYRTEHPKPQFMRENWLNLNGSWDFEIDHGGSGEARELYKPEADLSKKIQVPFCPESKLSGIGYTDFMNSVWYRREIEITEAQLSNIVILHCGAADYFTTIYVNGQKCGTFGELAALSFNGNKMITTSGGGALICRTEEEARQTKFYATQARDAAPHYQHTHIGYNYRMSNICAGIGRGQMFVLDEHIARRRAIHSLYVDLLKDVAGITVMENPDSRFASNFWLTCILVDPKLAGKSREDIRLKLDSENIETRPLWKPMHLQPVFTDAPFYGNGTSERLFDIGLCLPSGPTLTDEDIRRVVDTIRAI